MGRNWAIVIGVNHYRNLQRLNYAVQDAGAVRDYFLQEAGFERVYYFSDQSPPIEQDYGPPLDSQPLYTTLKRFLRTRFEQPFLQMGDNLWFFFAGHGTRYEDRDYLMPIDGDPGDVEGTAISTSYVTERLRRSGADNVVLLLDACRNQGRREGQGIGVEVPQGVITLFSCSPRESSYEIEELQQGAFTHTLLQGLRLQGEGNCATVERLDQFLRYQVPELNRCHHKPRQTPYATVEPAAKYHLILLPRQATLRDAETLKVEALKAEAEREYELAEQFWVRVLAVSPADSDAIRAIRRLAQLPSAPQAVRVRNQSRSASVPPSSKRSVSRSAVPPHSPRIQGMSRRLLMQIAGTIAAVAAVASGVWSLQHLSPKLGTTPESDVPSPTVSAPSGSSITLSGAGASFPTLLYQRWFEDFNKENPNVQISYQAVGSGAGVEQFLAGTVDFGATDTPLTDEEKVQFQQTYGAEPIQVPMTGGSIVFAYNLEGVDNLKLSRDAYCGIVSGDITNWNNPTIVATNQGVSLPDQPIQWVHRSDGSGTTALVTNHLAAACPNWTAGFGKVVEWPTGTGAKGNEGVTAQIQQAPGAIGYVEYAYADVNNLEMAAIENQAGNIVEPSPETAARAFTGEDVPADFALLVSDPSAPDAYPIVGLTWMLFYSTYQEQAKAEAIKEIVTYGLTTGKQAAIDLGYIPLDQPLIRKVQEAVATLQ
ncbi:MAG: hypothetical protein Kow00121_30510 [Elainellaceae cyanobacterium]